MCDWAMETGRNYVMETRNESEVKSSNESIKKRTIANHGN